MLALVATAVRATLQLGYFTNVNSQLYAAIREWRTGVHVPMVFSTDAYTDVYNGHIGTLEHLCTTRAGAFHAMMADVYNQARCVLRTLVLSGQRFQTADESLQCNYRKHRSASKP
jgi:hypothetical protein